MRKHLFSFILLALAILVLTTYYLYLRDQVKLSYEGKESAFIHYLISYLYPRFEVEKHRLDLAFFISKANQVIFRTCFLLAFIALLTFLHQKYDRIRNKFHGFFTEKSSSENYRFIRILFSIVLLYTFFGALSDLLLLKAAEAFYKPNFLFKILHLPFPSELFIYILYFTFIISCITTILNWKPIWSACVMVFTYIFIEGLFFSFEKTDHGYATLTYAAIVFPLLVIEIQRSKTSLPNKWALNLIQLLICLCYFFSGTEKLLISGISWIESETFKSYLLLHPTEIGLVIYNNNFLCTLLPVMALFFQLSFPLILFFRNLRIPILLTGVLFHTGTQLLFGIGGFLNPWILSYLFFIDWSFLEMRAEDE